MAVYAVPPAGYYDPAIGLSGIALKNALHDIIDSHQVYPYSSSSSTDVSDILKVIDEDPGNTNNVLLHYKGTSVSKASFGSTWNREHVWPQSKGADVSPKVSDVHHIFAEDVSLNSSRGNSVFNDIATPGNSGFGNEWTGDEFEVRAPQRGDVARAILYMDVRYPEMEMNDLINPAYNFMGIKSTLLAWHAADPPDAAEMLRNDRVYTLYQHNRNPFIDHPEYASLIYASVASGNSLTVASTNLAGATIPAGAIDYPFLSLNLTANSNEWDLTSVAISKLGTLGDGFISAAKLYRDMDNSGTVNAGDILLDTRTFTGAAATFSLAAPSRITTTQARFIIAVSLPSNATNSATLQVRVNANGLTSSVSGGSDTNPTFAAIDSNSSTVAGGVSNADNLNVSFVNRATATITPGATNYPLVSMNVSAATNEWDLASISVSETGTIGDGNISNLKLYNDLDNSGSVSAGDVLLDTRTLVGGNATFTLATPLRITTTQVHLLAVGTLTGVISNGQTLQLRINMNGLSASLSGGTDNNPLFSAFPSTAATITGGVTDGNTLSVSFANRAIANVAAGTPDVSMFSLQLAASANEWDLNTISIARLGTITDSQVSAVKLYNDLDADGLVDATDQEVGSTTFTLAAATFNLGGSIRIGTTPVTLLVSVDTSPATPNGSTIQLRLNANGITCAASGGADVNPTISQSDSAVTTVANTDAGTVKIVLLSTRASTTATLSAGSTGGNAEFIVLANHTQSSINLSGWSLKKMAGNNTLNLTGTIPPKRYFLIASSSYYSANDIETSGLSADLFVDNGSRNLLGGLTDSGTAVSVALFNGTEKVDGFGYGATPASGDTGSPTYRDGNQLSPFIDSTPEGETLMYKRKGPTAGVYADTQDNDTDFEIVPKAPVNSSSVIPMPFTAADPEWVLLSL